MSKLDKIDEYIPTRAERKVLDQTPSFSRAMAGTSYNPQYCWKLIEHLKKGKSVTSFAASIGVAPSTIRNWAAKDKDFAYALELAQAHSQSKWEDIAIDQAKGDNKGNGMTLQFMMKNLFPDEYKDKQEIEHKGGMTIMIDTGFSSIEADSEEIEEAEIAPSTKDEDLL